MSKVANILASVFERPQLWASYRDKDQRTVYELIEALLGTSGEVSGGRLACTIMDRYGEMDVDEKRDFFDYLATNLDVHPDAIRETLAEYEANPNKATYRAFMTAAEPKRQELIRRLNQVPAATGRLVNLRKELLDHCKTEPRFAAIDLDLRHLFASWFNRGFLVLRRISWHSPADVLEKIIQYEAVHEITSWADLRSRLEPVDRRCYAYFHPSMPDEPLIFVEVGLTTGIPDSIQEVLGAGREPVDPSNAKTAVFYSISNCQAGLAGVSFGNSLIKQVVSDLSVDLPGLKSFVTLSPIPGFAAWLADRKSESDELESDDLKKLAAFYLINEKRDDGMPLNPVSRFHLGNGASVFAIHTQADTSIKGMQQSHGVMVNYLYDLSQISSNHEGFVSEKKVAASAAVESLAKSAVKAGI